MSAPPPGAVYYPWRIYVGYAYTEAFEGDATTFTADIGAKFLKWGAEAGVERTKNNPSGGRPCKMARSPLRGAQVATNPRNKSRGGL